MADIFRWAARLQCSVNLSKSVLETLLHTYAGKCIQTIFCSGSVTFNSHFLQGWIWLGLCLHICLSLQKQINKSSLWTCTVPSSSHTSPCKIITQRQQNSNIVTWGVQVSSHRGEHGKVSSQSPRILIIYLSRQTGQANCRETSWYILTTFVFPKPISYPALWCNDSIWLFCTTALPAVTSRNYYILLYFLATGGVFSSKKQEQQQEVPRSRRSSTIKSNNQLQ